ncbi:hypothetical protein [Paraburkholderia domus]|uniref:Lipoprotein n=1 Tax=Paraburkholderia domus TaxID=2793075 RepID=A0A9N8N156_9BURK|nr:hypothetical protein [Paraburkholderia domus]MBK5169395.1 hypothetical protein [Burkholderia sp. R-70211]CAE6935516.1 hypothetical protein R70211_05367 [Paraburkholderia domus]
MKTRKLLEVAVLCLSVTACDGAHDGPGAGDIDAAVRRALDTANKGGVNALIGNPLPTSANVASVRPDGDCVTSNASTGTFDCSVSISLRAVDANEDGKTLHADLLFAKDGDGQWQTSGIDQALAVGVAKSLIDHGKHSLPGHAASQAS